MSSVIRSFIKQLVFGNRYEDSLSRKIHVSMTFLLVIIMIMGFVSNVIIGMNYMSNISILLGFVTSVYFYYHARNNENFQKTVPAFFVVSLVLLCFAWYSNAGYDGNIQYLMIICFCATYLVIQQSYRKIVFWSYFVSIIMLSIGQFTNFFPVIGYDSISQRFFDILIGVIIYLYFMYFLMDIIITSYTNENNLLHIANAALQDRNNDVSRSHDEIRLTNDRLTLAMQSAQQAWYELNIITGEVYVSKEYPLMLGYSPDTFMTNMQNWIDNIHPDDKDSLMQKFSLTLSTGKTQTMEYRRKTQQGEWLWLQSNGKVVEYNAEGKPLRMIGVHTNIQARKMAELALMEREKNLIAANATKDKLFSIIGHYLRNPLGSLRDMTKILSHDYPSFDDSERKELLVTMHESTEQVYELLDNLLDWSRSQRGVIQFLPLEFTLFSVANNCCNLLQLSATKKQIEIINDIHPNQVAFADPSLIHTVLRNLVTNAIKFTYSGGKVRLFSSFSPNDNTVIIAVQDSGTGIPHDKISQLFTIHSNASVPGTAGEQGTGLGLVLCREFIEKHEGKIWVESVVGKGSTFYFLLPNTQSYLHNS
jgi:two-component system sensor histidine kinase/response regulator